MNAPARALHDTPRSDWTREEIAGLFVLPFPELMFRAASVHRAHFDPTQVQVSQLLSIKTGGCPEDCGYCSQSAKYDTGLKASKLMEVEKVLEEARAEHLRLSGERTALNTEIATLTGQKEATQKEADRLAKSLGTVQGQLRLLLGQKGDLEAELIALRAATLKK
jgi:biotin synthase-like enzyme